MSVGANILGDRHEARQPTRFAILTNCAKMAVGIGQAPSPLDQPSPIFPMEHDNSYKRLFSNPEMVRDLFIGFVDEPWVADIDFDTLEHMQGHYVTDDLRDRENDIIWRVNVKGKRVYVYILLEFQSGVDKFMAVRMMGYLALLYQDLIHRGNLTGSGQLPLSSLSCYIMVKPNGAPKGL
jgi:Putative transposase, YhgA-like